MIPIEISLFYAVIYILIFSVFILVTLRVNPRIWLHDYPKEIQNSTKPKNEDEKKKTKVLSLLFIIIFAVFPLLMTYSYSLQHNESVTFLNYFIHFMILLQLANLNDLLIIDWLIFCKITPKFIVIPGTEGSQGYKNYKFHFIGFVRGAFISVLISLLFALICFLAQWFQ